MSTLSDLVNIVLPGLSHWIIWVSFLMIVAVVLILYFYPYTRSKKIGEAIRSGLGSYYVGIPIVSIISLYIFTKMLEGVLYHGAILNVDAWENAIVYPAWMYSVALFITSFGTGILIVILLAITIGILLLRKRWRYVIISLAAIGGAELLQVVIKALVQRVRPVNLLETGYSFPSGHAITATVYVALLIYSYKGDIKPLATRYILITLASAFFLAVSISRLVLHVHWFSDVLGALSLGMFWFMLLVLIERSIPGLVPAVKVETQEAKPIVKAVPAAVKKIANNTVLKK